MPLPSRPAERLPSPKDVENCRADTLKLMKQLQSQKDLCRAYYQEDGSGRESNRFLLACSAESHLEGCLERQFEKLAALTCKHLCHQVMTLLARDLRDMVYAAILDRGNPSMNTIQIARVAHERYFRPLAASAAEFPPEVCRLGLVGYQFQHCWDKKYCETSFIQELAETCYRAKTFEFHQDELYLLPNFLGHGFSCPAGLSQRNTVVPIALVRKLRLCVRPNENGWDFTKRNLDVLLRLETKANIDFILDNPLVIFNGSRHEIEAAIGEFQALFPIFIKLDQRGHKISVRFGSVSVHQWATTTLSIHDVAAIVQASIDLRLKFS